MSIGSIARTPVRSPLGRAVVVSICAAIALSFHILRPRMTTGRPSRMAQRDVYLRVDKYEAGWTVGEYCTDQEPPVEQLRRDNVSRLIRLNEGSAEWDSVGLGRDGGATRWWLVGGLDSDGNWFDDHQVAPGDSSLDAAVAGWIQSNVVPGLGEHWSRLEPLQEPSDGTWALHFSRLPWSRILLEAATSLLVGAGFGGVIAVVFCSSKFSESTPAT